MQLRRGEHISNEALERYAMGSVPEPALAEIEEHLLVCSQCQQQLKEIDEYIGAMRRAAQELQEEDESWKRFWMRVSRTLTFRRLGWAMAVTALVLGAVALRVATRTERSAEPFALMLETSRGSEMQHAPARRKLAITLDVKGLPVFSRYALELVDERGRLQLESQVTAEQSIVRTSVPDGLPRGTYFIRLYSPLKELLREYGLQID
ncbi:MAG TPA: hypothetical protein VMT32_22995 [Bryobacteraceae bacterium]|nr:hypothetical protein [Bryobacteraceae bacterium]